MNSFQDKLDQIIYNLESEIMVDLERVYKGKDTGPELGRNNQESADRTRAAIIALIESDVIGMNDTGYYKKDGTWTHRYSRKQFIENRLKVHQRQVLQGEENVV